jgi:RNA polymerase sigma-70 factor (ECF subfamily)
VETALRWNPLAVMTEGNAEPILDADAQLMLRFRDGDLRAFESLFDRHSRSVINFAFKFVRNREIAEELAQEIFLRVHDAAPAYRAEAKFKTWLYRIATNVCLNEIRKPHYRMTHQSLDAPRTEHPDDRPMELQDPQPGAQRQMERRALAGALTQAIRGLPEKQRVAFVLNKYQELSYAEVAGAMNTSEKAVKSLIHRAKEALATHLRPILPEIWK